MQWKEYSITSVIYWAKFHNLILNIKNVRQIQIKGYFTGYLKVNKRFEKRPEWKILHIEDNKILTWYWIGSFWHKTNYWNLNKIYALHDSKASISINWFLCLYSHVGQGSCRICALKIFKSNTAWLKYSIMMEIRLKNVCFLKLCSYIICGLSTNWEFEISLHYH